MKRIPFIFLAVIAIISLIFNGCTEPAPESSPTSTPTSTPAPTSTTEGPQSGGILKIGISSDARYLGDPTDYFAASELTRRPVIEFLARSDTSGKLQPWLAESWEGDSVSKTFTVKLHKGIKFHDGTEFNAEAVKFNWGLWQAAEAAEISEVNSIDIIDDYTVRVSLNKWDSTIEYKLLYWAGAMVSPTAWETNGKDWASLNPVGTGPFEFESWVRDESITFKKFDDYWKEGKPYLDGIEFVIIADEATRQLAFRKGEVDILASLSVGQANDLKADVDAGKYNLTALSESATDIVFIMCNGNPDSIYADARVRQAIEYAIDKQSIIEKVMYGYGKVANQWCPPGNWAHNTDVNSIPYDPDKAKELLAEAGKPDGFETSLLCYIGTDQSAAEAIQGMLAEVGIKAELNAQTGQAMWTFISQGWDGLFLQGVPADNVLYRMVWATSGSPIFISLPHSEEVDMTYEQALIAPDFQTMQSLTQELEKLIFENNNILIPLWHSDAMSIKYPKVQNDGFCATDAVQWTPEECWLEQ